MSWESFRKETCFQVQQPFSEFLVSSNSYFPLSPKSFAQKLNLGLNAQTTDWISYAFWPPGPHHSCTAILSPLFFIQLQVREGNFLLFKAYPSALDAISIGSLQEPYSVSHLFPCNCQSAIPFPSVCCVHLTSRPAPLLSVSPLMPYFPSDQAPYPNS